MKKLTFTLITLLISVTSMAAIPVHQAAAEKHDNYIDEGVYVGGHDHGPQSLLNVRHSFTPKFERIVFDLGQKSAATGSERPGFFHISIQPKPNRLIIDLENVVDSKVTALNIEKLFSKSPFFSKAIFVSDSLHKNLTLELPLKVRAQIEVFELVTENKPGRIVIDTRKL